MSYWDNPARHEDIANRHDGAEHEPIVDPAKPGRYRKLPVVIEAVQWTGSNLDVIQEFVGPAGDGGADYDHPPDPTTPGFFHQACLLVYGRNMRFPARLYVAANDGWLDVEIGEWIAKDSKGCYPIKDDIFEQTYGAVH